jgi:hypothetical protein
MDTEDRWYVDVGGSPKMMTLDELVEAYEAGQITAQSLVTEVGGTEWRTLAEVADLGEEEEQEAVPASAPAPVHAQSYPPQASYPPRAMAAPASAWPPVAVANPSRSSVAATSAISQSGTLPPLSMAPVVQDLSVGLDDDMPFKKSGKNKLALVGVAAALALGVAGFGLTRGGGETTTAPVAAAAMPIGIPNTPSNPTPSTPTPSTPAASPTPSEPSDSEKPAEEAKTGRLSDDMKAALLAQDKERSAKKKGGGAKSSGGARARAPRSSSKSDSVFRSGGSADDPLNSKL